MKRIFTACLLLLSIYFSNAQFKEIAVGPSFNEPYTDYAKFILLKKGNLMLAYVGRRDSIHIRIYDTRHKEITVKSFPKPAHSGGYLALINAFEINSDVVLFLTTAEDRSNVIYRTIIDANSGLIKKEEKIVGLEPVRRGELYAMDFGRYHVCKDPSGDHYAVIYCNNVQSDEIKKIEIVLFNKDHAEVAKASYTSSEKEFGYFDFHDMILIDSEKVSVLLSGYKWGNDKHEIDEKNKSAKVYLGTMHTGSSALSFDILNFPTDRLLKKALLDYNSFSGKIIVAAGLRDKQDWEQVDQYICFVDTGSNKADNPKQVYFSNTVYERAKELYGNKHTFVGLPNVLTVENDGGFSVLYEEAYSNIVPGNPSATLDIIVAVYDKMGKITHNYLVPKKTTIPAPFSMAYGGGFINNYRTFAYLKTKNQRYLLINDVSQNIDRLENNKAPKEASLKSDMVSFYFPLTGSDPIPTRRFLFEKPDNKEDQAPFAFGVSVYDKENDIFICLKPDGTNSKTKTVNVVWLKPQ